MIKQLVDEDFPDERVVLVMDNLNTHAPGSLYGAFEPTGTSPPTTRASSSSPSTRQHNVVEVLAMNTRPKISQTNLASNGISKHGVHYATVDARHRLRIFLPPPTVA